MKSKTRSIQLHFLSALNTDFPPDLGNKPPFHVRLPVKPALSSRKTGRNVINHSRRWKNRKWQGVSWKLLCPKLPQGQFISLCSARLDKEDRIVWKTWPRELRKTQERTWNPMGVESQSRLKNEYNSYYRMFLPSGTYRAYSEVPRVAFHPLGLIVLIYEGENLYREQQLSV